MTTTAAAPQGAGNGNRAFVNVTADGPGGDGVVDFTFWCKNAHENMICDITCAFPNPPEGTGWGFTELHVDDDDSGSGEDEQWDVDDNENGSLDSGEDDAIDPTGGRSIHSISRDKANHNVEKDKEFNAWGKVTLPKNGQVYRIELTVTNKDGKYQEEPTVGGGDMSDAVHQVTASSGAQTTIYYEWFELLKIGVYARNIDALPATSVTITPPPGVLIEEVDNVGDLPEGTWNAVTRTFTFTTPVPHDVLIGLNVTFSDFADEETEFSWEVGY